MSKDLDIVVYGATGFTGKLCVKYLTENAKDLTWAIAGRDRTRLSQVAIRSVSYTHLTLPTKA